ncbi:MAG: LCP family protein [Clostridiaceae bacterium]|nr:LCP family protein [Clostridiaceae bacterium]
MKFEKTALKKSASVFMLIVLALLSALGGYVTAYINHKPINPGTVNEGTLDEISVKKEKELKANILLLGKDVVSGGLTDVMMVFMVNVPKNQVNVISIPRDTKIKVNGKTHKINAAFKIGKEDGAIKAVKEVLGIPIHYYCAIDTKAFRDIIDALGGVEFELKRDYDYDDPYQDLHIHLKKGFQVLDGKKAEQLVRYRHDYARGDYQRIEVQQEFFQELIKQKLNPKYISKVPEIYQIVSKNITTNMTVMDAKTLAGAALKIGVENIKTITLPGEARMTNGAWYFIHDPEQISSLIDRIENGGTGGDMADTKAD